MRIKPMPATRILTIESTGVINQRQIPKPATIRAARLFAIGFGWPCTPAFNAFFAKRAFLLACSLMAPVMLHPA